MKKVLILAYFYPPCNLTAARRAEAFAVYLNNFGYYPVVVTREWSNEINSPADVLKDSGDKLTIVKNDDYEIHYLPYKSSFRDRLFVRFGKTKLKFLSKIFTIIGLVGQNYSNIFIPYSNLYKHSLKLIKSESIDYAVITANPFEIFKFGYLLNRKTGIKWIADYRDDWNTSELPEYRNRSFLIKKLESYYEKKWLANCSAVTTISDYYSSKLHYFLSKPVFTILNGFDFNSSFKQNSDFYPEFTIVYNGSLYDSQKIEIFLKGFVAALDSLNSLGLKLLFPGLAFNPQQAERVRCLLLGYENNYRITDRVPFKEVIDMQSKSHLMLMVPHTGIKGIPSSKLYEYVGLGKQVLLSPSDKDIIENTLLDCKLGHIYDNIEDIKDFLINSVNNKLEWEARDITLLQQEAINKYSRIHQTKELAQILNKI